MGAAMTAVRTSNQIADAAQGRGNLSAEALGLYVQGHISLRELADRSGLRLQDATYLLSRLPRLPERITSRSVRVW
jgi:hypothetical protein